MSSVFVTESERWKLTCWWLGGGAQPGRPSPGPQRNSIPYPDVGGSVLTHRGGCSLRQSLRAAAPAVSLGCRHSRLRGVPEDRHVGLVAGVLLGTWREMQLLCGPEQLLAFSGPEGLNWILLKARALSPSFRAPLKGECSDLGSISALPPSCLAIPKACVFRPFSHLQGRFGTQ